MKVHIFELRIMIWRYDWSSQFCTQLKQYCLFCVQKCDDQSYLYKNVSANLLSPNIFLREQFFYASLNIFLINFRKCPITASHRHVHLLNALGALIWSFQKVLRKLTFTGRGKNRQFNLFKNSWSSLIASSISFNLIQGFRFLQFNWRCYIAWTWDTPLTCIR